MGHGEIAAAAATHLSAPTEEPPARRTGRRGSTDLERPSSAPTRARHGARFGYATRPNHITESPAATTLSSTLSAAKSALTSVSLRSTTMRELRPS